MTPCPPYSSRSTHPPLLGPAAEEACQAGEGPEETDWVFETGLSLRKRALGETLKEVRLWPCVPRQVPTASHLCELRVGHFWDLENQEQRVPPVASPGACLPALARASSTTTNFPVTEPQGAGKERETTYPGHL